MIKIRRGVFETNSSSVHSLIICPKADYEKLERGELYIDTQNDELVTREKVIETVSKYFDREELEAMDEDDFRAVIHNGGFNTLNDWEDGDLEFFEQEYTTEHGDKIVAFGCYGSDY